MSARRLVTAVVALLVAVTAGALLSGDVGEGVADLEPTGASGSAGATETAVFALG